MAMQGQAEAVLATLQRGVEAGQAMGQTHTRSLWYLLLAEASGQLDQAEQSLSWLVEALEGFEASGRGDLLGEAYRLQGEFYLHRHSHPIEMVEGCFEQALEIAQQQGTSLELRAVMSLCRLWQKQERRAEAYDLLAPIYDGFTEGFDTVDLQEAEGLLGQLKG